MVRSLPSHTNSTADVLINGVLINGVLPRISRDLRISVYVCTVLAQRIFSIFVGGSKRKGRASKKESPCSNRPSSVNFCPRVKGYFTAATRPLHVVPAPALVLFPLQTDSYTFTHPLTPVAKPNGYRQRQSFPLSPGHRDPLTRPFSHTRASTHPPYMRTLLPPPHPHPHPFAR